MIRGESFSFWKSFNNDFSNQFGISGLLETWITPDKLYGAMFYFSFGSSLNLLQLFRRVLQRSFTVKPQKCFVDYKTSLGFPPARLWVDNDYIFIY